MDRSLPTPVWLGRTVVPNGFRLPRRHESSRALASSVHQTEMAINATVHIATTMKPRRLIIGFSLRGEGRAHRAEARPRPLRAQRERPTSAGDPIPGATVRVLDFTPAATAGRWIPDEHATTFDTGNDGDVAAAPTVCDSYGAHNGHR